MAGAYYYYYDWYDYFYIVIVIIIIIIIVMWLILLLLLLLLLLLSLLSEQFHYSEKKGRQRTNVYLDQCIPSVFSPTLETYILLEGKVYMTLGIHLSVAEMGGGAPGWVG